MLIVLIAGGVSFAFSREINIRQTIASIFEGYSVVGKIRGGIGLLKASPPLKDNQVALAVLNTKTGELTEHRIELSSDGRITRNDPTLRFHMRWWNSFNSFFEVDNHPELLVVANKFRVDRQYLPEQKLLSLDAGAPDNDFADIVYVPYSDVINTPEVVQTGVDYINTHVSDALKDLRKYKVMSRAVPGRLVADVVPEDLMKNIVLVEHVDPTWLSAADDGGKNLVNRVLVLVGTNQEWAYRYTNSSAGANGLAQFIKPTYDSLVASYPEAHLIKDHNLGMADHTNAFKAIALYFDEHIKDFPDRDMLAAVYNGGSGRVSQAVSRSGQNWETSSYLAPETIGYVRKYDIIAKLNIFQ